MSGNVVMGRTEAGSGFFEGESIEGVGGTRWTFC